MLTNLFDLLNIGTYTPGGVWEYGTCASHSISGPAGIVFNTSSGSIVATDLGLNGSTHNFVYIVMCDTQEVCTEVTITINDCSGTSGNWVFANAADAAVSTNFLSCRLPNSGVPTSGSIEFTFNNSVPSLSYNYNTMNGPIDYRKITFGGEILLMRIPINNGIFGAVQLYSDNASSTTQILSVSVGTWIVC